MSVLQLNQAISLLLNLLSSLQADLRNNLLLNPHQSHLNSPRHVLRDNLAESLRCNPLVVQVLSRPVNQALSLPCSRLCLLHLSLRSNLLEAQALSQALSQAGSLPDALQDSHQSDHLYSQVLSQLNLLLFNQVDNQALNLRDSQPCNHLRNQPANRRCNHLTNRLSSQHPSLLVFHHRSRHAYPLLSRV